MSYDVATDVSHIGCHVVPMSTDIATDILGALWTASRAASHVVRCRYRCGECRLPGRYRCLPTSLPTCGKPFWTPPELPPMSYDVGTDVAHIGFHVVPMLTDVGTDILKPCGQPVKRPPISYDVGTDVSSCTLSIPLTGLRPESGPSAQKFFFKNIYFRKNC